MARDRMRLALGLDEPEPYPEEWIRLLAEVDDHGHFRSPLRLCQEAVGGDANVRGWRIIVGSMLCVRTARSQSHPMLWRVLQYYPYPERMAMADYAERQLAWLLRPCGFQAKRAADLVLMSKNYVMGLRPPDVHGAGRYVTDAYRVFHDDDPFCAPEDGELRAYCIWRIRHGP